MAEPRRLNLSAGGQRYFPIMAPAIAHDKRINLRVPLERILPHEETAYANHLQTLTNLAARGGLDPWEALHVLTDTKWRRGVSASQRIIALSYEQACAELVQYYGAEEAPRRGSIQRDVRIGLRTAPRL